MTGEKVLYFRRLYDGEKCPNWDKIRQQHSQMDTCDQCYGTGFKGGYHRPIEISLSLITPNPYRARIYEYGTRRELAQNGWTIYEPPLQNKDFFVRRDDTRLWVVDVKETRWRGHILTYRFNTEEIEPRHPIYKLPEGCV